MLVLSRKTTESIVVDGRIRITILQVQGSKVRVGVDAPDDVRILREELATQQFVSNTELCSETPRKPYAAAES